MGLLDSVIGSVTGSKAGGSSGMSPLVKALLLLLAAKAATSHFGKSHDAPATPAGSAPAPAPSGSIESGILAGLPSLDSILDRLKGKGHEDTVQSWIGTGPNKPIEPKDLGSALKPEELEQLQKASGMPRDQLLGQLSDALPKVLDKLTPDGRLPGPQERSHW